VAAAIIDKSTRLNELGMSAFHRSGALAVVAWIDQTQQNMPNFADQSEMIDSEEVSQPTPVDTLERRVFRSSVVVLATLTAAYVLWLLVDLLLVLFACALVALILQTFTKALSRRTRLPHGISLSLVVGGLLALTGATIGFFGATMQGEFAELSVQLPLAWADLQTQIRTSSFGAAILDRAQAIVPNEEKLVSAVTATVAAVGGAVSALIIVLVGGLYLAAQPTLYAVGLLRLIPRKARASAGITLDAISVSLRNWLKGQALGMLFVGVATGLGLWLAGVPAAWAIGLVAGLAEFVPYLGIFVAVLPAVLLGFAQGTETGLWTIGILVFVQQLQGNVVMPIVQNHMVDLPPAITIFGIIAAGILFGLPGVLLATPLTIVVLVLVRRLYLDENKGEVLSSGDAGAAASH
jgi:predicted PurR-regulated permease PerM